MSIYNVPSLQVDYFDPTMIDTLPTIATQSVVAYHDANNVAQDLTIGATQDLNLLAINDVNVQHGFSNNLIISSSSNDTLDPYMSIGYSNDRIVISDIKNTGLTITSTDTEIGSLKLVEANSTLNVTLNNLTQGIYVAPNFTLLDKLKVVGDATMCNNLFVQGSELINGDLVAYGKVMAPDISVFKQSVNAGVNQVGYSFQINDDDQLNIVKYSFFDSNSNVSKKIATFGFNQLNDTQTSDISYIPNAIVNGYQPNAVATPWLVGSASNTFGLVTDIIPSANELYDLGSVANRWRDLYISGNTIDMAGVKFSKTPDNSITITDSNQTLRKIIVDEIQLGVNDSNAGTSSVNIRKSNDNTIKFTQTMADGTIVNIGGSSSSYSTGNTFGTEISPLNGGQVDIDTTSSLSAIIELGATTTPFTINLTPTPMFMESSVGMSGNIVIQERCVNGRILTIDPRITFPPEVSLPITTTQAPAQGGFAVDTISYFIPKNGFAIGTYNRQFKCMPPMFITVPNQTGIVTATGPFSLDVSSYLQPTYAQFYGPLSYSIASTFGVSISISGVVSVAKNTRLSQTLVVNVQGFGQPVQVPIVFDVLPWYTPSITNTITIPVNTDTALASFSTVQPTLSQSSIYTGALVWSVNPSTLSQYLNTSTGVLTFPRNTSAHSTNAILTATGPSGQSTSQTFALDILAWTDPTFSTTTPTEILDTSSGTVTIPPPTISQSVGQTGTLAWSISPSSLSQYLDTSNGTLVYPIHTNIPTTSVTLTATGPGGDYASETFTLFVLPWSNPVLTQITPSSLYYTGSSVATITPVQTAVNVGTLTWHIVQSAFSSYINTSTGAITIPQHATILNALVTVVCTGPTGEYTSTSFTLNTTSWYMPVVDSLTPLSVYDTSASSVTISPVQSQTNTGTLVWTIDPVTLASIDSTTGIITIPQNTAIDTTIVTVYATGPTGLVGNTSFTLKSISWATPILSSVSVDSVYYTGASDVVIATPTQTVSNVGTLTWTMNPVSFINASTGLITIPQNTAIAATTVTITATGPGGKFGTTSFVLTSTPWATPVINTIANQMSDTAINPFVLTPNQTAPTTGTLIWYISSFAQYFSTVSGVLTIPQGVSISTTSLTISATGPTGLFATRTFSLSLWETPVITNTITVPANTDTSTFSYSTNLPTLNHSATYTGTLVWSVNPTNLTQYLNTSTGVLTFPINTSISSTSTVLTCTGPSGQIASQTFVSVILPWANPTFSTTTPNESINTSTGSFTINHPTVSQSLAQTGTLTWNVGPSLFNAYLNTSTGDLVFPIHTNITSTVVTLTATGPTGESASETFTLTVLPWINPVLSTIVPLSTYYTGPGDVVITPTQTASNTGTLTWSVSPGSLSTYINTSTGVITIPQNTSAISTTAVVTATGPTGEAGTTSFSLNTTLYNTPAINTIGTQSGLVSVQLVVTPVQTASNVGTLTWSVSTSGSTSIQTSWFSTSTGVLTIPSGIPIDQESVTITCTGPSTLNASQTFLLAMLYTTPIITSISTQNGNTYTTAFVVTPTQTASNTGTISWSVSTTGSTALTSYFSTTTGVLTFPIGVTINQESVTLTANGPSSLYGSRTFLLTVTNQPSFSFSFTNAGATGQHGPTQTQCTNTYGTSIPGYGTSSVMIVGTGTYTGMQMWTVPYTMSYQFTIVGAGSSAPTGGMYISYGIVGVSTISLTAGHVIAILVGQQGTTLYTGRCGGNGGSFVYNTTTSTLLLVAGGSGGNSGSASYGHGLNGQTSTSGSAANPYQSPGAGGTSGSGGGAQTQGYGGDGGGGYSGDGLVNTANSNTDVGAKSFLNGGTGGTAGGFGGGGDPGNSGGAGCGGGGGYSGGGGGANSGSGCGGGGGGSYTSTSWTSINATNNGMGYVNVQSV
jgi:hypothetical protein